MAFKDDPQLAMVEGMYLKLVAKGIYAVYVKPGIYLGTFAVDAHAQTVMQGLKEPYYEMLDEQER